MILPIHYMDDLKSNICQIKFTKKDGAIRNMLCTLNEKYLPIQINPEEQAQKRKENTDVVSVWDTEANNWRSFRKDSIINFVVYQNV